MTSPCQNCPARRLVCHDYCPAYLEYHEERVQAREANRRESRVTAYVIEQTYRIERRVKVKRAK